MGSKTTVSVDFDGVLHSYETGWHGVGTINDPPVQGAVTFLLSLIAYGFTPAIFSARSASFSGRRAMKKWLVRHATQHFKSGTLARRQWDSAGYFRGFDNPENDAADAARWLVKQLEWPWFKPASTVILDDRAMRFDGSFDGVIREIQDFKPWNRR